MKTTAVLDVYHEVKKEDAVPISRDIYSTGWARLLPAHSILFLVDVGYLQVSYDIWDMDKILAHPHILRTDYLGLEEEYEEEEWEDEEEEELEQEVEEEDDDDRMEEWEGGLEEVYVQSGYTYPTNMQELVVLLTQFGILVEREWEGRTVLTPLLEGFRKPEDVLQLPEPELRNLRRIRESWRKREANV